MLRILDKLLLFAMCSCLIFQLEGDYRRVVIFIIGLIVAALTLYIENRKVIGALLIAMAVLCLIEPGFTFLLPLVFFDSFWFSLWWGMGFAVLFFYALSVYQPWMTAIWLFLSLAAVLLAYCTRQATELKRNLIRLRDTSTELSFVMREKNRKLLEEQDTEIYMATLKERNRIAREIHDTLGHTMTGRSAGIDACIALIDYSVDETKKQLSIISGVARQGLKDVRRSMKKLRPDTLERESLESAIEKLITETMSTSKVSIEFQSFLPSLVFEDDEEDTIYRIVQEGITNAIRHGHASRIFINFKKNDIWQVIRIRDNGIGCKDIHKGFGLTHMKERVDMLHGTVTYSSNNGFQVVAKLPIRWRNEER